MSLLILGIDQSLSNTGLALIQWDAPDRFTLLHKDTIKTDTKPGMSGYRDTIPRGDSIARAVREYIETRERVHGTIDIYAHEMPAVPTGKMTRIDASLIASCSVRATITTMYPYTPILMVQGQHMKKAITGLVSAEKREVKAAVLRLLGVDVKTNEHVYDACGIAMSTVLDGLAQEAVR